VNDSYSTEVSKLANAEHNPKRTTAQKLKYHIKNNPKHNAKHNAKNSKKRKEARSEEYLKFFRDNTPADMSPILTKTEVESRAIEIIQHPLKSSTGGLTLEQIAADESICFYVGITKMFNIQDEDLRWLTKGGSTPPPKKTKKQKTTRRRNMPATGRF
jgi:hypothetical protein